MHLTKAAVAIFAADASAAAQATSAGIAGSNIAAVQALKYDNTDGIKATKQLKIADDGFTHIADDGVVRSYAGNGTVIDAAPLSHAQLMAMIAELPVQLKPYTDHLKEVYAIIDGHNVPQDDWFNPAQALRPAQFGGPKKTAPELHQAAEDIKKAYGIQNAEDLTDSVSANPAALVKKDLAKRQPPACLGKTCRYSATCQALGCLACTDFDLILLSQRICVGVQSPLGQ